ncbi:MAG: flagellar hook protein [Oscillospiraceae bacterium]|nr:flagellar hook protein [Oscillospiraceae bacterium]
MSMIIQNNLNAINAHNKLGVNVIGTKKATEKLSSGFRINRAADDAAGLAISEKMRAQLRGIGQAIRNANDGISLIQTAEGALDETHAMLKRLKELAVLAGNETYTDEEREYAQMEIDEIKTEIDRIALATDFNGIKLLDGSLDGLAIGASKFGPDYAVYLTNRPIPGSTQHDLNGNNLTLEGAVLTSNVTGVTLELKDSATIGGENAEWSTDGKTLTLNLQVGQTYTQAQIDDLIKNAKDYKDDPQANSPAIVSLNLKYGVLAFDAADSFTTATGILAATSAPTAAIQGNLSQFLIGATGSTAKYADTIRLVANNYGDDARNITILTNADKGEEKVTVANRADESMGIKNGSFVLHLSTGVEYTEQDIQKILAKAGLDYTVELTSQNIDPNGDKVFFASNMVTLGQTSYDYATIEGNTTEFSDFAAAAAAWDFDTFGTFDDAGIRAAIATDVAAMTSLSAADRTAFEDSIVKAIYSSVSKTLIDEGFQASDDGYQQFILAGLTMTGINDLQDDLLALTLVTDETDFFQVLDIFGGTSLTLANGSGVGADKELGKGDGLTFQIGANNAIEQRVTLNIKAMDSRSIGIADFDVSTVKDAQRAMDNVEKAIVNVSRQRASLGAMQNRLEHTVNSLTTTHENLTAAESQIRDTDMAKEMVQYTKFNILQQAAQAMLAQANQAPQAVLQLLR